MFSNHVLRSSTAFTLISALLFPTLVEAGRTHNAKDRLGLESAAPKARTRVGEGPTSDIEKPKSRTGLPYKKRVLLDLVPATLSAPPPASSTSSEDVDMEDTQIVPAQAPTELLTLPNEILRQIFSHLGTQDLLRVRGTHHRIRDVVCDMMHQATLHSSSPEKYPLSPNTLSKYERKPVLFRFLARHHNPEPEIQIAALKSILQDLNADHTVRQRGIVISDLWEWILDPALNPAPLLDDLRQAEERNRLSVYRTIVKRRSVAERGASIAEMIISHPQNPDAKLRDYQSAIDANYTAGREQESPEKKHAYFRRALELYKEIEGIPSSSFKGNVFLHLKHSIAEIHYAVGLYEKDPKVKLDHFLQSARFYDQDEHNRKQISIAWGMKRTSDPLQRERAGAAYYEAGLCAEDDQTKYDYFSRSAAYYDPNLSMMSGALELQTGAQSFAMAGRYAADLDNRLKHYKRALNLELMACEPFQLDNTPPPEPRPFFGIPNSGTFFGSPQRTPFTGIPSFMPNPSPRKYGSSPYAPPIEKPSNFTETPEVVKKEPANYKRATEIAECIIDRTYNPSPSLSDLREAAELNLKAARTSESIDDKRRYFQRATTLHNEIMNPKINPRSSRSDYYFAEELDDFATQLETNPEE